MGWERYTGSAGAVVGLTGFGASAPGDTVMEKFGFTAERVVEAVLGVLKNPAARSGGWPAMNSTLSKTQER